MTNEPPLKIPVWRGSRFWASQVGRILQRNAAFLAEFDSYGKSVNYSLWQLALLCQILRK